MLKISYIAGCGTPQLVFEGNVSAAQVGHAFDAVVTEPEFARGLGLVVDATGLRHEYSHDEIRLLAEHVAAKREELGHRLAVVISHDRDLQYGLARMFASYAACHDLTVSIFHAPDEALNWLLAAAAN